MSHLHIPDGVLPPIVWIIGAVLAGLLLILSARSTRHLGPQRIAFQSALGGIMLAVMAIPVPITAFDYCMTLSGPVGVLLGGWGGFQVSFVVTLILALMGQGGFTVVGLNTLVLGLGAVLSRSIYLMSAQRWGPAHAMALATAISQLVSTLVWVLTLWLSVRLTPRIAGQHEMAEGLRFLQGGLLLTVLVPMLVGAIALESLLAYGLARFLSRVRPDLLPALPGLDHARATAGL
ncbi:MAG: energy-coupling factor ABC transporter permease [Candidatus Eisenbacteria bacterium]